MCFRLGNNLQENFISVYFVSSFNLHLYDADSVIEKSYLACFIMSTQNFIIMTEIHKIALMKLISNFTKKPIDNAYY